MAAFSEAATWEPTISGVDNGDAVNATETNNAPQQLTNRSLYLRTHGSIWARTVSAHQLPVISGWAEAGYWEAHPTLGVRQTDVAALSRYYQLELGAEAPVTVTQIKARLLPAGSHGGLPANMPDLSLWYWDTTAGGAITVATQADTSASVGAYEAIHNITLTLSHALSIASRRYVVLVNGESGANALAGLRLVSIDISWTAPT